MQRRGFHLDPPDRAWISEEIAQLTLRFRVGGLGFRVRGFRVRGVFSVHDQEDIQGEGLGEIFRA